MKYIKTLIPAITSVLVVLLISACHKDEDNMPMSNNPFNGRTTAAFNSSIVYGSLTDQEGNVYKTVTIGNQTWMAENLRTTIYNDGTPIPLVNDLLVWHSLSSGAYCNYDSTSNADTIATFGRLYNWHSVNTGKLAPVGWHVPTDDDWTTLVNYLGGELVAGGKLKEMATTHWFDPNFGATNESGFTALPGSTTSDDSFEGIGYISYWWSATEYGDPFALFRIMNYAEMEIDRVAFYKELGCSVRCIKD